MGEQSGKDAARLPLIFQEVYTLNQQLQTIKNNIDAKTVTSVVVGMAVFGAVMYAAVRTGIKPLKQVAEVAKGGK